MASEPSVTVQQPAELGVPDGASHASRRAGRLDFMIHDRTVVGVTLSFCLAVVVVVVYIHRMQTNLVEEMALQDAKVYSQALVAFRTLYTSEVVSRLESSNLNVDITHDYPTKPGAIPLPATLGLLLGNHIARHGNGGSTRLYSDYPFPWRRSNGGPRDNFEDAALEYLRANPEDVYFRIDHVDGAKTLRYATADRMRPECVQCHNSHPDSPKTDWKTGDVRGILEVIRPLDIAQAYVRHGMRDLISIMAIITLLGTAGLAVVIERLRRSSAAAEDMARKTARANRQLEEENRRTEAANQDLKSSEERFRALTESANDAIISADSAGNITYWNPSAVKIFGYGEDEVAGRSLTIIIPARFQEAHKNGLSRLANTGESRLCGRTVELCGLRKDNTEVPVELSLSQWQSGGSTFFLGIIRDITERKKTADELAQIRDELELQVIQLEDVNTELSQYTYVVSHDLQAPLRAVRNYYDFLTEDLEDELGAEQCEYLEGIGRAITQADELVEDLLELSRIGRSDLVTEPMPFPDFITDLVAALKLNDDVECHIMPDAITIDAECSLIKQIFQNLILNAVKFNRSERKVVEIGWKILPDNDRVIAIYVRDNGIGIASKYHEQIFRVFQRLHTRAEFEGTGIGLAIVKKACQKLGGDVRIEAEPGVGSTFTITLPYNRESVV